MREKRRLNLMEIIFLRRICGVAIRYRIRNEEIRRRVGVLSDLSGRLKKCVLMWFGYLEHLDGERMAKKMYDS